ncbi:MAG: hypothetical protein ACIARQ_16815 [Phycisphaerales bacterium JB061]
MTSHDSSTETGTSTREPDFGRPFRLTAGDLIGDLLWPKLLRVPSLALRPDRIGLAILIVLLIGLIDQTLAAIANTEESPATPVVEMLSTRFAQGQAQAFESVAQLAVGDALIIGWNGTWRAITSTFSDAPWRASFVLPVAFLIYITFAVGISRMAVDDFARGKSTKWTEALAWSLQGFVSTLVAHLIPILVLLLIVGVLSVGGLVLLGVPYLNMVGSLFTILGVLLAFVGVLVLIGFGLGAPMLSPAIASEGFDGFDAMQRVGSYIFSKPGRFAIYAFILFVQFAVVASIAAAIAGATSGLAAWSMGLIMDWTNNPDGVAVAAGAASEGRGFAGDWAARVVEFMLKLPALAAGGFLLCYWISGWSVQYLLLRQATDGQDVTDIFVPGEMEARIDRALASRVAGIDANQSDED